jgi:hypothetical protein
MAAEDEDSLTMQVRVPAPLLREAHRIAAQRDETVSQVVRRALRSYVGTAPRQMDLEDAIAATRHSRGRR